jgi:hypothetical protein
MALIALSALLSGCMSDAHEGDLPWSPTATWEGTPALPGGMMNTCKQLGPDKIEEVIAILALYRPGPMQFIPNYLERKWGREPVEYAHPLLEKISRDGLASLTRREREQLERARALLLEKESR